MSDASTRARRRAFSCRCICSGVSPSGMVEAVIRGGGSAAGTGGSEAVGKRGAPGSERDDSGLDDSGLGGTSGNSDGVTIGADDFTWITSPHLRQRTRAPCGGTSESAIVYRAWQLVHSMVMPFAPSGPTTIPVRPVYRPISPHLSVILATR